MFDYFISPPFILLTFPFILFFLWSNLCLSPHQLALHPHRENSLLTQESKKALNNPTIPQRKEEPIIVVCLRGRGEEFQELPGWHTVKHTHTHTQFNHIHHLKAKAGELSQDVLFFFRSTHFPDHHHSRLRCVTLLEMLVVFKQSQFQHECLHVFVINVFT